jgi:hypothetical protein
MKLTELLDNPPKVHPSDGQLIAWGLQRPILEFLDAFLDEDSRTLETGAGMSTILFALKGATHTCITPFQEEVDRIGNYCKQHGISLEKVDFRVDLSATVLPELGSVELDVALIDGCHGFPTPFMDWYFTAAKLKTGGIVIVDDVHIWTGRVLKDFLVSEPEWKLVQPSSDRTAIFVKERSYDPWKDFYHQPYVVRESQRLESGSESKFRKGLRLLSSGKILTLARKMGRQTRVDSADVSANKKQDGVQTPPGDDDSRKTVDAMPRLARRAAEQAVRAAAASGGSSDGRAGRPE